jgi:hypothetical protein
MIEELETLPLTPEQEFAASMARFRHKNGAYYAWVEAPIALMNTEIPEGVNGGSIYDGEDIVRQKDVGEFILSAVLSLDNSTAIGSLAYMERPTIRQKRVDLVEMLNWKVFLEPYGLTVDKWLDSEQYRARIMSEEYTVGTDDTA